MALPSRLCRFEIELADIDRGVYETLAWRVAQHPSEDTARLVVRVLTRALLYVEELDFGAGLSSASDPAIWLKDPGGKILLWVDVGAPSAERLHRANKAADKVIVVSHRQASTLRQAWSGKRIHKADDIAVYCLDGAVIKTLAEGIDRQNSWVISCNEGAVHISDGKNDVALEWAPRPLTSV